MQRTMKNTTMCGERRKHSERGAKFSQNLREETWAHAGFQCLNFKLQTPNSGIFVERWTSRQEGRISKLHSMIHSNLKNREAKGKSKGSTFPISSFKLKGLMCMWGRKMNKGLNLLASADSTHGGAAALKPGNEPEGFQCREHLDYFKVLPSVFSMCIIFTIVLKVQSWRIASPKLLKEKNHLWGAVPSGRGREGREGSPNPFLPPNLHK